ncbi:energy-coupling factor transporter transmembrane protein EcfT|uniref:Energy-coupling factor transport system permease protein n=1 Tax=Dendrosporobacter quercicolus TaxID=146817 RepID=A0A1G9TXQ9_9FIRM|nr:energy-coupling factor transporter transmembrane component T [Dendrosporobacter quercicolus]NSL48817.1 energy-coupling factor transporter transmembrane protein EcfT [Dendrosporobacter quercicolus DSM 1736]SDM52550.1 energy-coupling factor transport system permease protein [Dendrosporobacter quercicolus]
MPKFAPLTKLLFTVFVTLWSILLQSVPALALLIIGQFLLLLCAKVGKTVYRGVAGLILFAAILAAIQYGLSGDTHLAVVTALKMVAMTLVFFILLATTRMQDLSVALVAQCRVPHEYAFMLTAALRFIPDFLSESKAIQEAQACRGYSPHGNPVKRLLAYAAIVKPLVLKAVSRSETMALSLELRGFANRKSCSFKSRVRLSPPDYAALLCMVSLTVSLIARQFS